MGEILIPRRTKVEKGYELLADITVGTATTSVDISGLNIGNGDEVVLVSDLYNSYTIDSYVSMLFNSNNTVTNYYVQQLSAISTTVAGARTNNNYVSYTRRSETSESIINLKLTNSGYIVCQSSSVNRVGGADVQIYNFYNTSTFTASSVTSIRLLANQPNAIGIGSRFQLYKIN